MPDDVTGTAIAAIESAVDVRVGIGQTITEACETLKHAKFTAEELEPASNRLHEVARKLTSMHEPEWARKVRSTAAIIDKKLETLEKEKQSVQLKAGFGR